MTRKSLLICGIVAMLWYVVINIIVPMQYPGYDIASQTMSELSAIDAPTRTLWLVLCTFYSLLFMALGAGTWLSAIGNRKLRFVGIVIMVDAIFGFFWPPMHRREIIAAGGGTLTDTILEKFGYLTGRSLTTFKRDFKKIFNTTPQKWLTQKRLELAHCQFVEKSKKPIDVCYEVGFENLSRFSYVFKKHFGYAPTELLEQRARQ